MGTSHPNNGPTFSKPTIKARRGPAPSSARKPQSTLRRNVRLVVGITAQLGAQMQNVLTSTSQEAGSRPVAARQRVSRHGSPFPRVLY
jgi:hypothetical protein